MTHPDILTINRFGTLNPERLHDKIGRCLYCDTNIYESAEVIQSNDGIFCDMDCCREYYGIEPFC